MKNIKYQIECGTIADFIEAKNHEIAFRKLVKQYKNPPLAKLMRFREVNEENQPFKSPHFGKSDIGKWKYQNPIAILKLKKVRQKLNNLKLWKLKLKKIN